MYSVPVSLYLTGFMEEENVPQNGSWTGQKVMTPGCPMGTLSVAVDGAPAEQASLLKGSVPVKMSGKR